MTTQPVELRLSIISLCCLCLDVALQGRAGSKVCFSILAIPVQVDGSGQAMALKTDSS